MGRFVRIASEKSINVVAGLQYINATNENSQNPDRLNIRQMWTSTSVLIKKGVGYYPSIIKEWDTVKALQNKNILTIGEECDTCENQAEVEAVCEKLERNMIKYETAQKQFAPKKTKKTLSED